MARELGTPPTCRSPQPIIKHGERRHSNAQHPAKERGKNNFWILSPKERGKKVKLFFPRF